MCGRFVQSRNTQRYAEMFGIETQMSILPRYNVAPSQAVLAVRAAPDGRREIVSLHGSLVPY